MSIRVMTWVWERSRSRNAQRLVLLAIADCANDAGENAYPSMGKLTEKTLLSERAVQVAIGELVKLGELRVRRNAGPRGCNRYRIVMTPAESAPPQNLHPAESTGAESAPPQNQREDPAESAPGTVLEPSENSPTESSSPPKSEPPPRVDVEQVCRHLADRIEGNGSKRPTITGRWRDAARLLIDRDGRSVEQVIKAIDWCQDDDFWCMNILSMAKLREKYDQLRLAAQRANSRASPKLSTTDERVAAAQALKQKIRAIEGRSP